ncbi:hypothetical protein TNCV_2562321 [Trichonephila clavipes]|uniref:Uncharacterized protein n=1 Tax=Trichonephila clavipes TaxID=2585209 RepID=A0A8X6R2I6_TRICX|nr:hypothetical protein TNCV_2562321 [Trichonephila clavipes]
MWVRCCPRVAVMGVENTPLEKDASSVNNTEAAEKGFAIRCCKYHREKARRGAKSHSLVTGRAAARPLQSVAPYARIISTFSAFVYFCHRTASLCDGNKASFQRTPSYRSVPLAANSPLDGEICIFCLPLTPLAKIFAENPARFIHRHDTCNPGYVSGFDGLFTA